MEQKERSTLSDFLSLIDKRAKLVFNSLAEKFLHVRNAIVVSYDEETRKAMVTFDDANTSYTLYNKTNEVLSDGDSVRVFYTSAASRGWIGMRLGEPNISESSGGDGASSYTTAIKFTPVGFDLTFESGGKSYTNIFEVTEDESGNITKISNKTSGKDILVTYEE